MLNSMVHALCDSIQVIASIGSTVISVQLTTVTWSSALTRRTLSVLFTCLCLSFNDVMSSLLVIVRQWQIQDK